MSSGGTRQTQRIENLPPEAWTPEVEALFPIMLPPDSSAKGSDFNSILLLAHHPRLSEPWLQFNAKVARGFTLSAREREIAILRVAWRRGSEYEWVHHMLSGARAGLTVAHFAALQSEEASGDWSELETVLIRATDEICLSGGVAAGTLAALRQHLSTEQLFELLYATGCYIALAAILNTAGAAVEPQIAAQAASAGLPHFDPLPKAQGRSS
ncbi:carboxymuconolactone decarboxylase family protein [Novosphingobium sp. M1R2S20]|uniref:Carboxymuconolactone decarboxylase family protein n=1 Tax=Novosphingobium rhizovicinum TaxID=3228928 RepID=A0ABV3REB4_9SPHN